MPRTVFWSWQSDQPGRETRDVIRAALVDALATIAVEMEEAERPEIDQDTRGVPGSPEIVATILAKIDRAGVFVGDVTPIAVTGDGKHLPNPNVLIELGYAKKALTSDRVVLVWNTAFSGARPEDLPFDLRHRRAPISYSLPPGSSAAQLRAARQDLARRLEEAVRASLASVPPELPPEPSWQSPAEGDVSIWNQEDGPLVVRNSFESVRMAMGGRPRGYARLVPAIWNGSSDALALFEDGAGNPIPLGSFGGLDWGPTQGGFLVYRSSDPIQESGVTPTATRWFRDTGEFWGVASSFFVDHDDAISFSNGSAYECWIGWLDRHIALCKAVGGGNPFFVKLGLVGLSGTRWPKKGFPGEGESEALEKEVHTEFALQTGSRNEFVPEVDKFSDKIRVAYGFRPLIREVDAGTG